MPPKFTLRRVHSPTNWGQVTETIQGTAFPDSRWDYARTTLDAAADLNHCLQ